MSQSSHHASAAASYASGKTNATPTDHAEKLTVRFPQDDGVVAVLEVVNDKAGDVLGTFTFEFIPIDAEPISCAAVDGPPLGERCETLLESV